MDGNNQRKILSNTGQQNGRKYLSYKLKYLNAIRQQVLENIANLLKDQLYRL